MIAPLKCGAKEGSWECDNQGKFMNKNITEIFNQPVMRFIQEEICSKF